MIEHQGGKAIAVFMSREILGLSKNPGRGGDVADHKNHDIREETEENLRVANNGQSAENRGKWGSCQRFKGIYRNGNGYTAAIQSVGSRVYFPSVPTDIEAGLVYRYAAIVLHDKFLCIENFPLNEMPSRECRWGLMGMVIEKLRLLGHI
jgi:hypothetical protein